MKMMKKLKIRVWLAEVTMNKIKQMRGCDVGIATGGTINFAWVKTSLVWMKKKSMPWTLNVKYAKRYLAQVCPRNASVRNKMKTRSPFYPLISII